MIFVPQARPVSLPRIVGRGAESARRRDCRFRGIPRPTGVSRRVALALGPCSFGRQCPDAPRALLPRQTLQATLGPPPYPFAGSSVTIATPPPLSTIGFSPTPSQPN